jgi:hypothetical protein
MCVFFQAIAIFILISEAAISFIFSGFLPKVVGREKPKHPSNSPQAGGFRPARVHVWDVNFFLFIDFIF